MSGGHEEVLAASVTDHKTETGSWKQKFKGTEGHIAFLASMKHAVNTRKGKARKRRTSARCLKHF